MLGYSDEAVTAHAAHHYLQACAREAMGDCEGAVPHYRRAFALERALDADESDWPAWLTAAVEAQARMPPDAPLPCIAPARHVALAPLRVDADVIIAQLRAQSYACVDGLIDAALANAVGSEIRSAYADGRLAPGQVDGDGTARVASKRRGDWVAHVRADHNSTEWSALQAACAQLDGLVSDLRAALTLGAPSVPMVTRYADGARYAMHFDNHCIDEHPWEGAAGPGEEQRAPCSNERRLTCVVYANGDWAPGDGGELRIYRTNSTGSPCERHALVRAEVSPVGGRVLLFWSDYRCPHEVLGAWRERLAVTVWYARRGS